MLAFRDLQHFPFSMAEKSQYDVSRCIICQETNEETLSKVSTGLETLIKYSKQWSHEGLRKHLNYQKEHNGDVLIHVKCRKDYTNQRRLNSFLKKKINECKPTRQTVQQFDWKKQCFYCGKDAIKDPKHPDRNIVHLASTLPFRNSILNLCEKKLQRGQ